ncbi:MAG: N-acetylmuramoyl-L-alanine amidase [Flavobacteriia bacterium]|nr:N-acetylmuramoyl-L-alanine amidase [Flavobacteriia bacterium]
MKYIGILLFILFLDSFNTIHAQSKIVLVIDAGHGGSDPGHLSENPNHLPEKDLNLAISKLVGGYIDQFLTNIEIVYTRKEDSFVSLDDRVEKANSINATYFISIHCNANDKKHIHGTESHIHDFNATKAVSFAKELEHQFSKRAGRHSRGIKDNGDREHTLQVLKYTKMTGVLIECGFLTNEKEANYLNTSLGQEVIASAIFRAFRSFIQAQHPNVNFIKDSNSPKEKGNVISKNSKETFTIQLMSSKTAIEIDKPEFQGLGMEVKRLDLNTQSAYKYLYVAGTFTTKEEAKIVLEKVKKKGFKDAIIIPK